MPENRFNGFTDYRIGIGLRAPHCQHILSRKPVVDWFEIELARQRSSISEFDRLGDVRK
jgi:hypothetical protein